MGVMERNIEGIKRYMEDRKEAYNASVRGRVIALTLAFSSAFGGYVLGDNLNSKEEREAAITREQQARKTLVGENDARLQDDREKPLYQEVKELLKYTDNVVKELTDLTSKATSEREALYDAVRQGIQFQNYLTAKIEVLARNIRAMQDEGTAEYETLVGELKDALKKRAEVKKLLREFLNEPVPEDEVDIKLPELGRVDLPYDTLAEFRARVERIESTPSKPSEEEREAYAKLSAASRLYAVMEHEAADLTLKCERLSRNISDDIQVLRDLVEGMRTYKGNLEKAESDVLKQINAVTEEYSEDKKRVEEEELLRKKREAEAEREADNPPNNPSADNPPNNPSAEQEQPPADSPPAGNQQADNPPADE